MYAQLQLKPLNVNLLVTYIRNFGNCLGKVILDKQGHKKTIFPPTPSFHFLFFFYFC